MQCYCRSVGLNALKEQLTTKRPWSMICFVEGISSICHKFQTF